MQARYCLEHYDLRRAGAFLPLADYKRDTLVLFESPMTRALNFAEVSEEVFAAGFRRDKAKSFVIVEPLHDAGFCFQCKS